MNNEIKSKMQEHIKQMLEKPSLSNEDYALMDTYLSKNPEYAPKPEFMFPLLMLMFSLFGGDRNE